MRAIVVCAGERRYTMTFPDRRTLNMLLTTLLFAVVLATVYVARGVLIVFAFAILLAYLIDPVVRFLQSHALFFRKLRGPHVLEAYLTFLICLAFLGHALAPGLTSGNGKLFKTAPALIESLSTGEIAESIGQKYHWNEAQRWQLKQFLIDHREFTLHFIQDAEGFASNAAAAAVVVPILAIFFLAEGRVITDAFIQLFFTENNRPSVREIADELNVGLRRYIRAKVILAVWSFAFYAAAMLLARFPHAVALAALGGALEFIPVAGWMSSAAVIVTVGVFTHSHWIWMAALLGVWRLTMDYFISPRVVGHNLEVHPLLVILAVMVGAKIDGIVGIYLSIPLIVVVCVLWQKGVRPSLGPQPELLSAGENH
jgi:predicted PurR-regulated permease PerM